MLTIFEPLFDHQLFELRSHPYLIEARKFELLDNNPLFQIVDKELWRFITGCITDYHCQLLPIARYTPPVSALAIAHNVSGFLLGIRI